MHWPKTEWLEAGDFSFAVRHLRKTIDRNPPSDEELLDVVAWMAGPDSPQKYSPSLREMVIGVFMFRKFRDGSGVTSLAGNSRFVEDVKRAMQAVHGWRERWNILCQPSFYAGLPRDPNYDETLVLAQWAERFWPEWEERVFDIKQSMAAGIRQARLAMENGGIRNESIPRYADRRAA